MEKISVTLKQDKSPTLTLKVDDLETYEDYIEFFNLVLKAAGCSGLEVAQAVKNDE